MSRYVLDLGQGSVRLTRGVWRIGRDVACEVNLDDPSVSRRHASLRVSEDSVEILDAGSRNGIQVNGHRVYGAVTLSPGDMIQIGTYTLRLLAYEPGQQDTMAPPTRPLPKLEDEGRRDPEELALLSPREREVLARLARGETQKEVAESLGVSVKTIETYRARIARKLDLRTRSDLIRFALEAGMLRR